MSDYIGIGAGDPAYDAAVNPILEKQKRDRIAQTLANNAKATAQFPDAAGKLAAAELQAKQLTPTPDSLSLDASNALGLSGTGPSVASPRVVSPQAKALNETAPASIAQVPVPKTTAPTLRDMVSRVSQQSKTPDPIVASQSIQNDPEAKALAQKAASDPSFMDMLKKIGFPIAGILQGFAYGMAGRGNQPTVLDTQSERQYETKKTQQQAEIQQAQAAVQQQYAKDIADIEQKYRVALASTQNDNEKAIIAQQFQNDKALSTQKAKQDLDLMKQNPAYALQRLGLQSGLIQGVGNSLLGGGQ